MYAFRFKFHQSDSTDNKSPLAQAMAWLAVTWDNDDQFRDA